MLDRSVAREICEAALARSQSDATEIVLSSRSGNSLRLAESGPSEQNALREASACIRVERDGRQGRARVDSLDPDRIGRTLSAAWDAARVAPRLDLPELAGPVPRGDDGGQAPDAVREIGDHDPEDKVRQVRQYLDDVRRSDATATGFYVTESRSTSYATCRGCFRHAVTGRSWFSSTVLAGDGAGVAHVGRCGEALDAAAVTAAGGRALRKALDSRAPRDLAPGDYTVLLEPQAVCDLVLFLSWAGLGGRGFLDGSSFLTGRIGERVLSPLLTLRDDAAHPAFRAAAFDLEGQDRHAVTMIEAGVARGPVWDRPTAREGETESTGHGGLQPSATGPSVSCLVLEPGDRSPQELLASVDRGLLVTQLHYTNLIEPRSVTVTGMTRNGTFLVENGRVVAPVRNLRFTQSLVGAFSDVAAVGDDPTLVEAFFGGVTLTPSLLLRSFRFTSTTEF